MDLTSPSFISALNEVSKCGVDQLEFNEKRDCDLHGNLTNNDTYYRAKFWSYDGTAGVCAPVRLYNQIADEILKEHSVVILGDDVAAAEAKYYAKLNVAMVDAGITAWCAKYEYISIGVRLLVSGMSRAYWKSKITTRNRRTEKSGFHWEHKQQMRGRGTTSLPRSLPILRGTLFLEARSSKLCGPSSPTPTRRLLPSGRMSSTGRDGSSTMWTLTTTFVAWTIPIPRRNCRTIASSVNSISRR